MEDEIVDFIKDIDLDTSNYGFKLKLLNVQYIDIGDNAPCSGYFSEDLKEICVSVKARDFIGILAHEYSHFRQFIEDEELYNFYGHSYTKMFEWLDGKRIQNIDFHLQNCLDLELDCEKRVVKLIKQYDLGIDVKDYIKRANAYMYFWKYLKYSRKWCNPYNTPSNNEKIVSVMPNRFLKEYELTDSLRELFRQENI